MGKERKNKTFTKLLKLITLDEPSKSSFQDSRLWRSVKTDFFGYQELVKKLKADYFQ